MDSYNSVLKIDLNGEIYRGIVFDMPIIKKGEIGPLKRTYGDSSFYSQEQNEKRNIRRAKTNVSDYVKTNVDLNYFVTYTLDSQKIDRYDEKVIYEKMRNWLSDRVKRKNFKYILVPEQHKDGAWHFHGFTNQDLKWSYGFQSAKKVKSDEDKSRQVKYITSYIKKDMVKFNGRRYLHSRNLDKPVKVYDNVDFEKQEGKCVELKDLGVRMKIR